MESSQVLKNIIDQSIKEMEEFAKKYPKDIGKLYKSYKRLKDQKRFDDETLPFWADDILTGYLLCIGDLIIIKKGHWGQ